MLLRWTLVLVAVAACESGSAATPDAPIDSPKIGDTPDGPIVGEVLKNGDFESLDGSGWLTDWTRHEGDPNGQLEVVTTPVHGGTHALQWQMSAATGYEYFVIQDPVMTSLLVPGTSYEVSGWVYIDTAPGPADIGINYIVRGEPGDDPDLETVSAAPVFPTVANAWERFHFPFMVPVGAAPDHYQVYLHSIKGGAGALKLTVDDVSIHVAL